MMHINEATKDEILFWSLIISVFPAIYLAWHLGIFQAVNNWTVSHIAWFFEHWRVG